MSQICLICLHLPTICLHLVRNHRLDTNNYKHAVRCITTFVHMGALTYDVSSRGGFKMLTVAEKGEDLSLADVSKNT